MASGSQSAPDRGPERRSAVVRGAGFFAFWVILIGFDPVDLGVGVLVAIAATWVSLRLAATPAERVRLTAVPRLALRFIRQSLIAGLDVARRAFDPRLPLRPGFVRYPPRTRPGLLRSAFASQTSLLPGSLAVSDDGDALLYHCLDLDQPVIQQLTEEELTLRRALHGGSP